MYGKLYQRDWMAKVAWDQAPHWGDERCIYPFFCLFAPLRILVPGNGKSCFSHLNASNFRPPLQSVLHIRLKILRLPNFNMLSSGCANKIVLFSCLPKVDHVMKSIKAHIEGPLVDDGMEVSRRKLGTMVRQTAINKCLASFV